MATVPRHIVELDLLVFDAKGEPVLVVETKRLSGKTELAKQQLQRYATAVGVPYGLVVDLESAELFDLTDPEARSLLKIPTHQLLTAYAHGLDANKVSERYLVLLVDTWLRNVMQPLESDPPPAYDQLTELGVTDRLHDGHAEVEWRGSF
jgi:hypothetical protein